MLFDIGQGIGGTNLDPWILQSLADLGEKVNGGPSYLFIDVDEGDFFKAIIFDHLPHTAPVAPSDDENPAGIGMRAHQKMSHHLMVGEFILVGEHEYPIQCHCSPILFRFKHHQPLVGSL